MLQLITSRGKLDGIQPITIHGIVEDGHCISVRVDDGLDGQPISWGMTDRQITAFKNIIENRASQCQTS